MTGLDVNIKSYVSLEPSAGDGQGFGHCRPRDLDVPARPDLFNKAGFKISQAHTGAVTLIQRFGSALNLNLHFHVLFIDGVFRPRATEI